MKKLPDGWAEVILVGLVLGLLVGGVITDVLVSGGAPGWRADWVLGDDVEYYLATGDESDLVTWAWEFSAWTCGKLGAGRVDQARCGQWVVEHLP